jgi:hypothetical protein
MKEDPMARSVCVRLNKNGDHDERALRRNLGSGQRKIECRRAQSGERRPFLDWVTAVLFCPKPC